jgi:hypothetical protein
MAKKADEIAAMDAPIPLESEGAFWAKMGIHQVQLMFDEGETDTIKRAVNEAWGVDRAAVPNTVTRYLHDLVLHAITLGVKPEYPEKDDIGPPS